MKNHTAKGPITVLGIDLAKQRFQLHGVNVEGEVVLKKQLNRKQLSAFMANLSVCLIGLETCGGVLPSLGENLYRNRAYSADDGTSVCQTLC